MGHRRKASAQIEKGVDTEVCMVLLIAARRGVPVVARTRMPNVALLKVLFVIRTSIYRVVRPKPMMAAKTNIHFVGRTLPDRMGCQNVAFSKVRSVIHKEARRIGCRKAQVMARTGISIVHTKVFSVFRTTTRLRVI